MNLNLFKPAIAWLCQYAGLAVAVLALSVLIAVAIVAIVIAMVMTVSAVWVLSVKIGIPFISSLF